MPFGETAGPSEFFERGSKCRSSPQSVVPFMILVVFVKSNLIVTYIVSFAAGVGVASAFLLPW